jgi:hypothetical protein
MTDKFPVFPEESPKPAGGVPRERRISTPKPKKRAQVPKEIAAKVIASKEIVVPLVKAEVPETVAPANDWPEPEAASTGGGAGPENPKRKRRRKKGKGNNPKNPVVSNDADPQGSGDVSEPVAPAAPEQSAPRPQPRIKLDKEAVAKLALKIYLAEVSEEGVALIGDNDAKELSRRCFRLSEIFLEEQARRR